MKLSNKTALVVIDVQERLVKAMNGGEISDTIKSCGILIEAFQKLNLPVIFTEQYPKGLGFTVETLQKYNTEQKIIEKTTFSCFGSDQFSDKIRSLEIENLVICGIETHVCVQQTAFDAKERGLKVVVVSDAVCSRKSQNKSTALSLMLSSGIIVTSLESLLFAIVRDSAHPAFKEISKILR